MTSIPATQPTSQVERTERPAPPPPKVEAPEKPREEPTPPPSNRGQTVDRSA